MLQTDDRQTDGQAITHSEREHEFTFAKNEIKMQDSFASATKQEHLPSGGSESGGLRQYIW